jgi:hypothetical protein
VSSTHASLLLIFETHVWDPISGIGGHVRGGGRGRVTERGGEEVGLLLLHRGRVCMGGASVGGVPVYVRVCESVVCICVCMFACVHVCVCVCVYMFVCICLCVCMCVYVCTRVCMRVYWGC